MERIAMSQQERDELDWLRRAKEGSISQREAAQKMGVSDRWVRKLLKRMIKQGDAVVVHGLRGRPSNRKLPAETQRQAVKLLKQPDWHDFGPTFASQQLAKRHGIEVSDETVRKWMIEAGLWQSKSQRLGEVHVWRPRRSFWRTGAMGHLGARLAGRKRTGALPGAHDRRRDQLELGPLRRARCDTAQHGCAVGVPGEEWPDGGRLYGPRFDVHRGAARGRKQRQAARSRPADAARASLTRTGNRVHSGLLSPSERAH